MRKTSAQREWNLSKRRYGLGGRADVTVVTHDRRLKRNRDARLLFAREGAAADALAELGEVDTDGRGRPRQ
jgi:hypothetical protein